MDKKDALEELIRVCRLLCNYKHTDEDFKIELETLKTSLHEYDNSVKSAREVRHTRARAKIKKYY